MRKIGTRNQSRATVVAWVVELGATRLVGVSARRCSNPLAGAGRRLGLYTHCRFVLLRAVSLFS